MNRVVVTGLGMVSPLACGVEPTWRRLLAGESAAARVESFDVSDIACQIAAQVPRGVGAGRLQPRRLDGAEGAAARRRLHRLRVVRGDAGAARRRLGAQELRGPDRNRRPHRLRHRRPAAASTRPRSCCTKRARAASRRSSFPAGSSISRAATFRSPTVSKAPTTPSSPPARRARMRSATPRASSRLATPR